MQQRLLSQLGCSIITQTGSLITRGSLITLPESSITRAGSLITEAGSLITRGLPGCTVMPLARQAWNGFFSSLENVERVRIIPKAGQQCPLPGSSRGFHLLAGGGAGREYREGAREGASPPGCGCRHPFAQRFSRSSCPTSLGWSFYRYTRLHFSRSLISFVAKHLLLLPLLMDSQCPWVPPCIHCPV